MVMRRKSSRRKLVGSLLAKAARLSVLGPLLLGACAQNPETAHVAVQPRSAPVRTITSFDEALRCMDALFVTQGQKEIYVTSAGIPDATGQIAAGTKEMLITAIAKMSARSNAFHYVDFDPTQSDVWIWEQLIGAKNVLAPRYYLRGAITQLDSNVLSSMKSAGVSLPLADIDVSHDQVVSVMSVDLNIGELTTRQIIPGMSANNSIAVVRTGSSGGVGGVIGKAGVSINLSFDRAEGFHQAARNLIELSVIESLGKLTRVPYWRCLDIESTNPAYRAQAHEWFDAMTEAERLEFARSAMTRAGYYHGTGTDAADPELRDAVARYQSENDIVPNGRVDFDLYYRVLASGGVGVSAAQSAPVPPPAVSQNTAPPPAPQPVAPPPVATTAPVPVVAAPTPVLAPQIAAVPAAPTPAPAPRIFLMTDRGAHPKYRVNDVLALQAATDRDAYVYCYYKDDQGTVARIFPNRFQPDALIHAATPVGIPPSGKAAVFSIRFEGAAKEAVVCIASNLELGLKLPAALKAQDLEQLPTHNLSDIVTHFHELGGNQVTEAWLPIEVGE